MLETQLFLRILPQKNNIVRCEDFLQFSFLESFLFVTLSRKELMFTRIQEERKQFDFNQYTKFSDLVGLVTPPIASFVHSIKGHRGHEGARVGQVRFCVLCDLLQSLQNEAIRDDVTKPTRSKLIKFISWTRIRICNSQFEMLWITFFFCFFFVIC